MFTPDLDYFESFVWSITGREINLRMSLGIATFAV